MENILLLILIVCFILFCYSRYSIYKLTKDIKRTRERIIALNFQYEDYARYQKAYVKMYRLLKSYVNNIDNLQGMVDDEIKEAAHIVINHVYEQFEEIFNNDD